MNKLACFKAYDIRGKVPSELNEDLARAIGRAYVETFPATKKVAIGRDMRLSSAAIAGALAEGFNEAGVDVVDIGLGGTELSYFAAFHLPDVDVRQARRTPQPDRPRSHARQHRHHPAFRRDVRRH